MRPTYRHPKMLVVLERSVTRAVYQALAVASWLYERAGFYGPVDVGVVVLGIEGAGGASQTEGFRAATEHRRATARPSTVATNGSRQRSCAPT